MDLDTLLTEAINAAIADRWERALDQVERAVREFPEAAVAWGCRGEIFEQLGRYDEALESYGYAAERTPDSHEAARARAALLQRLGRLEESLEGWKEACLRGPDFPDSFLRRAQVERDLMRYDEALESLARAEDLAPAEVEAKRLRGVILRERGQHEEAVAALRSALRVARHHGPTRRDLSLSLGELGRVREANLARPREPEFDPGPLVILRARHDSGRSLQLRYREGPGLGRLALGSPSYDLPFDAKALRKRAKRLLARARSAPVGVYFYLGLTPVVVVLEGKGLVLAQPSFAGSSDPTSERCLELSDALSAEVALAALHERIGLPPEPVDLFGTGRVDLSSVFEDEVRVQIAARESPWDQGVRIGSPSDDRFEQAMRPGVSECPLLGLLVATQPRFLQALALPVGWTAWFCKSKVSCVTDARGQVRFGARRCA